MFHDEQQEMLKNKQFDVDKDVTVIERDSVLDI